MFNYVIRRMEHDKLFVVPNKWERVMCIPNEINMNVKYKISQYTNMTDWQERKKY